MDFKTLTDKIQEAVGELHRAIERQDAEIKKFGAPLAESRVREEKMQADITLLLKQRADLEKRIDELETKQQRGSVVKPGGEEAKEQKAAFYKWVRHGNGALSPEERKALVQDATGQILIEPELDAELVRLLPKITVMRGLATVRTIGKNQLKIRNIGGVSVGWGKLETGTVITQSTLTPGPATFQHVEDLYGLAKIGEDMLMDSDFNLEAILAEEFSRALGEEEDTRFILGTGHANAQPEGITTNATLVAAATLTAAVGAITVEDMMALMYAIPAQFQRNGVFLVNSATELALRRLREGTGTGAFLWQPSVQAGTPNTLLGKPIHTQDDIRTLADVNQVIAVFGDIRAGYRIVDRMGMTIQRLTELYSEQGLVGFKIHKRVTGGVTRADQRPIALLRERT